MKKNEKIFIGILLAILVIMIAIVFIGKYASKSENKANVSTNIGETSSGDEIKKTERIIKVKSTLYYDTGEKSTELRCGMMDGQITSYVAKDQIPTEENQANFEGAEGYQYGRDYTIEVPINGEWHIFAPKSFYGTIKKVEYNKCFFVEPDEGEEIRKSADLIEIGMLRLETNVKFEIGERIKVIYTGEVLETYPAQIYAISYESMEEKEFELRVYDKQPQTDTKIHTILDKSETDKYDYNIYTYDVSVNILINGEELSLKNALLENKITMEEIITKANQNCLRNVSYDDGGSTIYYYENYTLIKLNKLDGNRDVYIGTKDLKLNDLQID